MNDFEVEIQQLKQDLERYEQDLKNIRAGIQELKTEKEQAISDLKDKLLTCQQKTEPPTHCSACKDKLRTRNWLFSLVFLLILVIIALLIPRKRNKLTKYEK